MGNAALRGGSHGVGKGKRRKFYLLVGIPVQVVNPLHSFHQNHVAAVSLYGRIGVKRHQEPRLAAPKAGLLGKLAYRGGNRVLPALDHATRNLKRELIRAKAKLPHQHNLPFTRQCDDIYPVGGIQANELPLAATHRMPVGHPAYIEHHGARKDAAGTTFPTCRC